MTIMRVLICASAAPLPPMDGFRLLLDQLVRGLRASHEVRIVAPWPAEQPPPPRPADLRLVPTRRGGRLMGAVTAPGPLLRSRPLSDDRRVTALWPAVEHELATFSPDVVHVTSGRLAGMASRLAGWPTVLGAVDARHLNVSAKADAASGLLRLILREQARRIRHLIATDYDGFGHITVVTAEDRDALLAIDPNLPISVVPNGVDTTVFRPDPDVPRDASQVVFTGTMSYAPNVTAASFLATDILPRVREQRPGVRLVLAGRKPAPTVVALADRPGVTVTGEVPDIRPWLLGSQVFVAPMTSGTGIKNKLLEAMACGLPCVASPLALQGLEVRDGREVLIADGASATAAAIDRVLADPPLADQLGREARRYVERQHSWSRVVADHVGLYERVRGTTSPRSTGSARAPAGRARPT
jgi:polysaccharide biosynthesis protein PslH